MQTAVGWLIEQFAKNGYIGIQDELQAKEMEKQQMKGMYIEGSFAMMRKFDGKELVTADEYISETYGSKGIDETNVNNVEKLPNVLDDAFNQELFNYFSQEFNINLLGTEMHDIIDIVKKTTSSQTEISNENAYTNGYLHGYNAAIAELPKEISDEEMIKAAIKHSEIYTLKFIPRSSFIDGAKWYREQLKKK